MITEKKISEIGIDYDTIKLTKSRIDKGLLAIPVSIIDKLLLPENKRYINVYLDNNKIPERKTFTPYRSSSGECRIGGLRNWYMRNNLNENSEVVIQLIDKDKFEYRIFSEDGFKRILKRTQIIFNTSKSEREAEKALRKISSLTNRSAFDIALTEYLKLRDKKMRIRKIRSFKDKKGKENVPPNLRKILEELYNGRCQLTNFTFIQTNGKPYFEVHHINENIGNHIKNLLVVSPNIHAMLTYASKEEYFDIEGWLRKVKLYNNVYIVNHAFDKIKKVKFQKTVHI